jgi:metal-responsive CopG/Arc/MetJ family transcriptional regulator
MVLALVATMDAIAASSGISRSEVARQLIKAGLKRRQKA